MTKPAFTEGFILHRRSYRETSFLLEILTSSSSRISTVYRGGKRAKNESADLFTRYALDVRGSSGLQTLATCEALEQFVLRENAMYAGLYLNELICRAVLHRDEMPGLFANYVQTVKSLTAESPEIEPVLRGFENSLLSSLGYAIPWRVDTNGNKIRPEKFYNFRLREGFHETKQGAPDTIPGHILLAIGSGDYGRLDSRRTAKRVLRQAIHDHIGSKPLISRELFQEPSDITSDNGG